MSITYTWTISAMDAHPQHEGKSDVVYTVHWRLEGTDGTYTGSVYGTAGVTYASGEPFTEYGNLTLEQVTGWVKESLGAEQVSSYETAIAGQIAKQVSPDTVTKATPW